MHQCAKANDDLPPESFDSNTLVKKYGRRITLEMAMCSWVVCAKNSSGLFMLCIKDNQAR